MWLYIAIVFEKWIFTGFVSMTMVLRWKQVVLNVSIDARYNKHCSRLHKRI